MSEKKIWFLISDGLGVRNFAYNGLDLHANKRGFELTYWNNTVFRLDELGLKELEISNPKNHPMADVFKKSIKEIELSHFFNKTNNPVYNTYRFPFKYQGIKSQIKEWLSKLLEVKYSTDKGIIKLRHKIKDLERKTDYYQRCLGQLKEGRPSLVFNSSQRHIASLAPILAAQDLGIPTVTFIFSWDNLPKATLVVEADYYFVWSDYMKEQLLFYHPFIKESQIFVTGTTQFDWHIQESFIQPKNEFFESQGLDSGKEYICFSGDDVVTSPNDPAYLRDLAEAVRGLNQDGKNLGILFRRCPVDFSDRFDQVQEKYSDVIFPMRPRWKKMGKGWNFILPEKEDLHMLSNVCEHCLMVVNVGSSMVFDFNSHDKSCYYLNYDVTDPVQQNWTIRKVYKYIHFESMPSKESVGWINEKEDFKKVILQELDGTAVQKDLTKSWFEKINVHPVEQTSDRFFSAFDKIIS